ncbi:MAG: hypothetical protein Q8M56_14230, partial [Desulfobacterales bacterium]|nr:hypothetical protein [Desulfobacterales bacterium]
EYLATSGDQRTEVEKKNALGDLCITPSFARLRRQAQISILEILNVFLWLKLSPSLYLAKIGRSSKVSPLTSVTIQPANTITACIRKSCGIYIPEKFVSQQ